MKKFALNTLLVCISLIFSLLLAEFIVMIIAPQNLSGSWRVRTENGLMVNKSSGQARHQFRERVVQYNFTEPHLRAPAPEASNKILVLGDSFTFGWLLNDRDTYVNLLQSKTDVEFGQGLFAFHNAAAGGWGTGDIVAFVEDYGELVDPNIILVFINTYDIGRALERPHWEFDESKNSLTRVDVKNSNLMEFKAFLNSLPGYQWVLEHSHLVQLARVTSLTLGSGRTASQAPLENGPTSEIIGQPERAKALGAALFSRLKNWTSERNIPLIISTTGFHIPPYSTDLSEPTRAFMSSADSLFTEIGIPFFDPSDVILQQRNTGTNSYMIPNDGHPNETGAALIAEQVFPFIHEELTRYCRLTDRCSLSSISP